MNEISYSDIVLTVETIVFSGTLIVMVWQIWLFRTQLREMAKERHLGAFIELFKILSSDQAREDRKYVYNKLPSQAGPLSKEDFSKAERVWASLDYVGLLIDYGIIPENLVMEMYHEMFIKCWMKLEPHIKYQQKIRGGRYQKYFQKLVERSEKYHKEYYPKEKIEIYPLSKIIHEEEE